MEIGKWYWTYYINHNTEFTQVVQTVWKNDRVDQLREQEGRIFDTREKAKRALEAAI